jgi:glucokinase
MSRGFIIGIDVGATKTRLGIGDVNGRIYAKRVYRTVDIAHRFADFIVDEIKRNFSNYLDKVVGVGVASIGPLDLRRGTIVSPPNAPLKNVEVVAKLREGLGKEVFLVNDAVAAAWAEKIYGMGRGFRNLVYITLSTGIGAGVIVDDHLLLGKDGNAHEVGHIVVDYMGMMRCGCGGRGHWEAYCSGINIPAFVKRLLGDKYGDQLEGSSLCHEYRRSGLTAEALFRHAKQGDALAAKIVEEEIGRLNAAGIASVVNCYDPEVVFLGGAIALNNEELVLRPIAKYVDAYATNRMPKVTITDLREDASLKGAMAIVAKPPASLREYFGYL